MISGCVKNSNLTPAASKNKHCRSVAVLQRSTRRMMDAMKPAVAAVTTAIVQGLLQDIRGECDAAHAEQVFSG